MWVKTEIAQTRSKKPSGWGRTGASVQKEGMKRRLELAAHPVDARSVDVAPPELGPLGLVGVLAEHATDTAAEVECPLAGPVPAFGQTGVDPRPCDRPDPVVMTPGILGIELADTASQLQRRAGQGRHRCARLHRRLAGWPGSCTGRGASAAARTPAHGDRGTKPEARETDARFEALVLDFLAYLEFERGLARNTLDAYRTDLLQFGAFLAARDRDATEVARADVADFLADLATGVTPDADGNGGGGMLAGDDQPEDGLPAFLLQAPAARGADRRRSDRVADPADEEPQAPPRPQPRRGDEAARERRGGPIRLPSATGRCSR